METLPLPASAPKPILSRRRQELMAADAYTCASAQTRERRTPTKRHPPRIRQQRGPHGERLQRHIPLSFLGQSTVPTANR
jgi:hypothetical protein